MYEFKTEPFDHQKDLFDRTADLEYWGLLWEQGCGKSKPLIDTASKLFLEGKIDGVLLVAPGGVERNWLTDEIPAHMPDAVRAKLSPFLWQSKKAKNKSHAKAFDQCIKSDGLAFLAMNYNSFMTEKGKKAAWRFLRRRRVFYILDESDDIKTPAAKRSRSIVASAKWAPYRRIATGTPADKPFDIYTQLRFLKEDIWRERGMDTFAAFKNHYARWFTRTECEELHGYDPGYNKLIEYQNLPELAEILASISDRVLKDDVLDLPPKLYTKRYFDMTPQQSKIYTKLRDDMILELDNETVTIEMAIVRLLRLQQITCGYMIAATDEPVELIPGGNPRLDCTIAHVEKLGHQSIIWARFTKDIDQIMDALGKRAVRYDGTLSDDECERSKLSFNGGEFDHFVANPAKGARGLTVNIAKTTTYYSNSFKWRDRIQSEDRNHRYGQDGADHGKYGFGVLFADILCPGTVDDGIVDNLRGKFDIASQLTGDKLRTWI